MGEEYFNALSTAWRSNAQHHQRNEINEEDLDDSYIFDCIEEYSGPAMTPAVPLLYMIDLLTPQWEEEGLYEVARRREAAAMKSGERGYSNK
ncbi:hypothetical protein AGDE_17034 [Angomonas deanei]|uniref:Uncharacterized protein n=1 Tax=Angomonas deanei TaxID=59799 RepID=A0A7G2CP62_9TRYP|nr:hypothetical protein AGDE_17034 [Angomonas deanei]CAD2221285.1 hypothetical protein, conserved [Angomonas deanei]|eukprot:EPY15646.1 hypothetical protein AGDE_17034 [Angomonas deanei]